MNKIVIQRIDGLIKYLPIFKKNSKYVLELFGGKKKNDEIYEFPYFEYTNEVNEFFSSVSDQFWVDKNYLNKISHDQINDDNFIVNATFEEIKCLLTFCNRSERFSSGSWENLLKTKRINLILERLKILKSEIKQQEKEITEILEQSKLLAKRYKKLTNKPLGITGEVAEFVAAKSLNLILSNARQEGYDAISYLNGFEKKIQIKGRCISNNKKNGRLGAIKLKKEWDSVLLVLLNDEFDLINIYESERKEIETELKKTGSKSRNERGALSISKFISISNKIK